MARSRLLGSVCERDRWSVKLDVRDLGGHLDFTFRGWSAPLAARVRLVVAWLVLVFALPLDFYGRLRVIRSMFIPAALHGIEASFLADAGLLELRAAIVRVVWSRRQPSRLVLIFALPLDFHGRVRVVRSMFLPAALLGIEASLLAHDSLLRLRSAVCRVVWSRRQPLANPGAVLSLMDGLAGCDPAFCVVWFRFRMLSSFLAYRPGEVAKVYRILEHVAAGCPGHGPVHLLFESAAEIGFLWSLEMVGWARGGLPVLSNLASPIQHSRAAILEGWRFKVSADLCARKGLRGGPWLDVDGASAQEYPCWRCLEWFSAS